MHYSNQLLPPFIRRCLDTDISRSWDEINDDLHKIDTTEAFESSDPNIVQPRCKSFLTISYIHSHAD